MSRDALRLKLARLAHAQWSGWMKYLFSKGTFNEDGTWSMPAWAVERWRRQMDADYDSLPDEEKESDLLEADRVLAVIDENKPTLVLWQPTVAEVEEMIRLNNPDKNGKCPACGAEVAHSLCDWSCTRCDARGCFGQVNINLYRALDEAKNRETATGQ